MCFLRHIVSQTVVSMAKELKLSTAYECEVFTGETNCLGLVWKLLADWLPVSPDGLLKVVQGQLQQAA